MSDAIKAAAEKVLGGSDSGEAQQQARHVLNLLVLVKEAEEKYARLQSTINSDLAQLQAEAGDLAAHKARAVSAESEASRLGQELEALKGKYDSLSVACRDLVAGHAAAAVASTQVEAALAKIRGDK